MGDPTIQPTGLGANGLPVVPNVSDDVPNKYNDNAHCHP